MTGSNSNTPCQTCNGSKVIAGQCECDSEWRGTSSDDEWEDCQCTPEVTCPTCNGKGTVE
jgi:hypothetical protein